MRFAVVATALAAIAAAAWAVDTHGALTFEPSVPRVSVTRPAFAIKAAHSELPQPLLVATEYVKSWVPGVQFVVKDFYTTKRTGVSHVYLRQVINGIEVANGDANVNIDRKGLISSAHHAFFQGAVIETVPKARISPVEAVQALATYISAHAGDVRVVHSSADGNEVVLTQGSLAVSEIKARLMYIQTTTGELRLTWNVNADLDANWYDSFVNAETSDLEALYDWVHYASYRVYPIGVNDPDDGERVVEVNPQTAKASPLGWHDQSDGRTYTTTIGNNVYAQENFDGSSSWQNNYRPDAGAGLNFDYPIDFSTDPKNYIDASVTNLFFWNNIIHDILYEYGFDEVSGNFQETNFNNGGLGNDAVQANAQDGAGYNNANFATPPDGQRPRMRMYVWTTERPYLDGDLDNGIIIHEYAHGISNRLTGGPSNSNCLGSGESGGMGEGWGDCYSLILRWRESYNTNNTVFGMGVYAAGDGIRLYDYARNMTINPQTYSFINGAQYNGVHAKGCYWCSALYDMFLMLVDKYGFDADQYTGNGGNNRAMLLITDGMKLQPCRPTMIDARNAIIESNRLNYGGADVCELWNVFARRGLGFSAATGSRAVDGFDLPAECQ